MKLKMLSVVAVALLSMSFPAFADGGANSSADAMAGAMSGANASGGTFTSRSNSVSVSAAYCTDGLAVGGVIAYSRTIRACIAAQIAKDAGMMGTLPLGKVRAIQLEALDRIGFGDRPAVAAVSTSSRPAPKAAARPAAVVSTKSTPEVNILRSTASKVELRIDGVKYAIKGENLARWNAGSVLDFGGVKLSKE